MDAPCRVDADKNGTDWTLTGSGRTRAEAQRLATICKGCPLRAQCLAVAAKDAKHSEGIWGGLWWRKGSALDVLGKQHEFRSMYRWVTWEAARDKWRAFAQRNGNYYHLGYFDYEDEHLAAAAVEAWREQNGMDPV